MKSSSAHTVAIGTLGCKVNQAESQALARQFVATGCRVQDFESQADAYLLNTCTVTHVADRKARQMLRQARRRNPTALIVALGCGASAAALLADVTIDNAQKAATAPLVLRALAERGGLGSAGNVPSSVDRGPYHSRTRAFVKVQDGCTHRCTYCIVPLTRGEERSVAVEQVLAEVLERVQEGCQEVVLTGPRLGVYRDPLVGDLVGLAQAILGETESCRLRLSSLEPQDFSPRLLDLWPNPRLCRHFHLPLQSGSDTVLARMGRGYTGSQYAKAVETIWRRVPGAAITTDLIVGFPGESEREFAETCEFARSVDFARLHVFPYSARPGTTAATTRPQVPEATKYARAARLRRLGDESAARFRQRMVAQTAEVLYEESVATGWWTGLTDNYQRVFTPSMTDLTNRLASTRLTRMTGRGLEGELITCENMSVNSGAEAALIA